MIDIGITPLPTKRRGCRAAARAPVEGLWGPAAKEAPAVCPATRELVHAGADVMAVEQVAPRQQTPEGAHGLGEHEPPVANVPVQSPGSVTEHAVPAQQEPSVTPGAYFTTIP